MREILRLIAVPEEGAKTGGFRRACRPPSSWR